MWYHPWGAAIPFTALYGQWRAGRETVPTEVLALPFTSQDAEIPIIITKGRSGLWEWFLAYSTEKPGEADQEGDCAMVSMESRGWSLSSSLPIRDTPVLLQT